MRGLGFVLEGEKSEGEELQVGESLSFSFWVENGKKSVRSRSVRVAGEKDLGVRISVLPFLGTPIQEDKVFEVERGGVHIIVRLFVPPGTKPQEIKEIWVELRAPSRDLVDREKIVENLTIPESIFSTLRFRKIDPEEGKVTFFWKIENRSSAPQLITFDVRCSFNFLESESFTSIGDNTVSSRERTLIRAENAIYPVTEMTLVGEVVEPSCSLKFERKK